MQEYNNIYVIIGLLGVDHINGKTIHLTYDTIW